MKENTKKRKRGSSPAEVEDIAPDEAPEQGEKKVSSRLIAALIAVAAFAFLIYSVISLIGIQSQINERRQELNEIKDQITVQEIKNDEMNKIYNLTDSERSDYIERIARDDLDYVKEGERVFVNVAGD